MNGNRLYSLLQSARQSSFADGLRAGDYSIRKQLTDTIRQLDAARAEIAQQRITISRLQTQLDNARGDVKRYRKWHSAS